MKKSAGMHLDCCYPYWLLFVYFFFILPSLLSLVINLRCMRHRVTVVVLCVCVSVYLLTHQLPHTLFVSLKHGVISFFMAF